MSQSRARVQTELVGAFDLREHNLRAACESKTRRVFALTPGFPLAADSKESNRALLNTRWPSVAKLPHPSRHLASYEWQTVE